MYYFIYYILVYIQQLTNTRQAGDDYDVDLHIHNKNDYNE